VHEFLVWYGSAQVALRQVRVEAREVYLASKGRKLPERYKKKKRIRSRIAPADPLDLQETPNVLNVPSPQYHIAAHTFLQVCKVVDLNLCAGFAAAYVTGMQCWAV
jgi:hypothetical protein